MLPWSNAHTCYAYLISPPTENRVANWTFEPRLFAQPGLKWTLGATHHFSAQKTAFDSREKWFPAGLGVRRGGWWIEDGGCAPLSFYASERKASIDFFPPLFADLAGEIYEEKVFAERIEPRMRTSALTPPVSHHNSHSNFIKML